MTIDVHFLLPLIRMRNGWLRTDLDRCMLRESGDEGHMLIKRGQKVTIPLAHWWESYQILLNQVGS